MKPSYIFGLLRIALGSIFAWAFFDKLFGLNFTTPPAKSWLNGNSPTLGYLKAGVKGPFADFFHALAGNPLVDWLFMIGLAGIGIALMFGIAMRLATITGVLLLLLLFLTLLPPEHHPFMDEHIIYALTLMALYQQKAGKVLGFENWWLRNKITAKLPFLK